MTVSRPKRLAGGGPLERRVRPHSRVTAFRYYLYSNSNSASRMATSTQVMVFVRSVGGCSPGARPEELRSKDVDSRGVLFVRFAARSRSKAIKPVATSATLTCGPPSSWRGWGVDGGAVGTDGNPWLTTDSMRAWELLRETPVAWRSRRIASGCLPRRRAS